MTEEVMQLPERPESLAQLLSDINPAIYERLKTAIELGKWADGTRLTANQLEHCLRAMILYEAEHLPPEQRTEQQLPRGCGQSNLASQAGKEQAG